MSIHQSNKEERTQRRLGNAELPKMSRDMTHRKSSPEWISMRRIWLAVILYVWLVLPAMKILVTLFMKTVGPRERASNYLLIDKAE